MATFQFISLPEAKRQVSIGETETDDDALLNDLIEDATALVASEINRKVYETDTLLEEAITAETAPDYAISLEDDIYGRIIKRLTKLLVAHCFKHREPVSEENAKPLFLSYTHALTQVRIPVI